MRTATRIAAVIAAIGAWASVASAHELRCEKTLKLAGTEGPGAQVLYVDTYPAEVKYTWTIFNVHPTDVSVMRYFADSMFVPRQEVEVAIPVGGSVTDSRTITVESYDACLKLSEWAFLSSGGCVNVDNRFTAGWESGEAQCTARLICRKPPEEHRGPTRTMGFFKTHIEAAEACLAAAGGSIDLGFITIDSLPEFLGVLWGSPARYASGAPRTELDQLRFLLARQTMVATCNEALFATSSNGLVAQAVAALDTTVCADISGLIGPVTSFNESGDAIAFPDGFKPGTAAPLEAEAIGSTDPTTPSGEACTQ